MRKGNVLLAAVASVAVGVLVNVASAQGTVPGANVPVPKERSTLLKGISPVISPDLLKALAEMGHGDEIVVSDAFFPAHTFGRAGAIVLRADGVPAEKLLAGVTRLIELDTYVDAPTVMMRAVPGDSLDPAVEAKYRAAMNYTGKIERMERFAFYERAKKAYVIVVTGETAKYGNIILKKGIIAK